MNTTLLEPRKALNKAFLKIKPNRSQIENFKENLIQLLNHINEKEQEEFHKNLVIDFLKKTYYDPNYFVNTKGRNDLVIHNGKDAKSNVGVIIEAKRPASQGEMITVANLNGKALQELVLYYMRERITHKNTELKHLVVTNIYEWFVFDAQLFNKLFAENKHFTRQFIDFEEGRLSGKTTDYFYKDVAKPFIEGLQNSIEFAHFDIRKYEKPLRNTDKEDDKHLVALFKLLSPEHLLKLSFVNDSNSLDKNFYSELLHVIGLTEVKEGGKKLIERQKEGNRNSGSLLENAIDQLDSLDKISRLQNPKQYGDTHPERLFNVALELTITWVNRILFLKLLEAQLISYHKGDKSYSFLNSDLIRDYDNLNSLFFQVLAKKPNERNDRVSTVFAKVPYLNSSLFEPTDLEHETLFVSQLEDNVTLSLLSNTVIKDNLGKKQTGTKNPLDYFLSFLDAYDFASEGSEDIQEDNKTLINASVLGLIFEKINGYKDGSFFTPSFITMYMCKETIRRAVVQKFNETKNWNCTNFDELYDKIENGIDGRNEANTIINSLKICDPAVGSGHFLVSALNEIIAIKNDLRILQDNKGSRLKEFHFEVVNDELIVTDNEDGIPFQYNPKDKDSRRVQETLFHEKQTIIENCLFGVDINPNSVKICRLRLWIELLKNAYYRTDSNELETLPNIDINIKCGNSLISRFELDADLKEALKKSKLSIDAYKNAVNTYRNADSKEQKREMEVLIGEIKTNFRSEINANSKELKDLIKDQNEYYTKYDSAQLFEASLNKAQIKHKKELAENIKKKEDAIEEIKSNKIYENAFEWRFEFPDILNDEGDFVGFDVIIGNPPYLQLSKTEDITDTYKKYLLETYQTSGGRLNTFIFFIHLSNRILHSNGFQHFIIPNTILSQEYYSFTRDFLVNKVSLTEIVNFPTLPFEDAVVETVLIQYANRPNLVNSIEVKELSKEKLSSVSKLERDVINRDSKYSFVYDLDPVIEKIFEREHDTFGSICEINQGIALKGDKSLSLKDSKENDNCFKLLDGRNINKYSIRWDDVYIDYDIDKIHSCKRKDIFESSEKLMFRRVSSSLIFTYDNEQFFALNTLVVVNKIDNKIGPDLKFILGLMNSKLMNYVYSNKFKSTKKVFSEIQAGSVKELPIPKNNSGIERQMIELVDKVIYLKKLNNDSSAIEEMERQIDLLVYQLYDLTKEEIEIVEGC
jgi:adenine-specific DNA-methyltransferase